MMETLSSLQSVLLDEVALSGLEGEIFTLNFAAFKLTAARVIEYGVTFVTLADQLFLPFR